MFVLVIKLSAFPINNHLSLSLSLNMIQMNYGVELSTFQNVVSIKKTKCTYLNKEIS
jgi:hypothetical protein